MNETYESRNPIDTKLERQIWFTHLEGPKDAAARSALSYLYEINRLRDINIKATTTEEHVDDATKR